MTSTRAPSRWKVLLKVVIAASLLLVTVRTFGDASVPDTIQSIGVLAFLIGALFHLAASILIPAIVTSRSLQTSPLQLSLPALFRINLSIRFYSMTLPSASSTAIRFYKYQRQGSKQDALATLLIEKAIQLSVYSSAGTAILLADGWNGGARLPALVGLGSVSLLTVLMLVAMLTKLGPTVVARLQHSRLPRFLGRSAPRLARLARSFESFGKLEFRTVVTLFLWTLLSFALFVSSALVIAEALDLEVSFATLAWMRGFVFLLTQLPITLGGIGVREAGFVGLLAAEGIDHAAALAFSLALLAIQVALGITGGLIELSETLRRRRQPDPVASQPGGPT